MSFPNELTAFRTYAKLYPSACILLVDTYDTLKSGIPHAIQVFQEMREAGIPLTFYGIRLDSGDLAYLSKKAKKMLDDAGFPDAVISASNKDTKKIIADLICLVGEEYDPDSSLLLFDPVETWKKTHLAPGSYVTRELMIPVFLKGKRVYESPKVMDIQKYCKEELSTLWEESRRLEYPHRTHVDLSMPLWKMRNELLDQVSGTRN